MDFTSSYLLSSLPQLKWLQKPVFSSEELLERWKNHQSPKELNLFEKLRLGKRQEIEHSYLKKISLEEKNLHKKMVAFRKSRFSGEAFSFEKVKSSRSTEFVSDENWLSKNPLEREISLDYWRWNCAEKFVGGDVLGFNALISYFLRTLLLEKYAPLEVEKGRQIFQQLTEAVLQSSRSEMQEMDE